MPRLISRYELLLGMDDLVCYNKISFTSQFDIYNKISFTSQFKLFGLACDFTCDSHKRIISTLYISVPDSIQ